MSTGTIYLPTLSAVALFEHELKGQLSDGMWENSGPRDHWKFWTGLDVELDPSKCFVETPAPWACKKTGYNIASLYPIIGDLMVACGRMGAALGMMGWKGDEEAFGSIISAAEYITAVDVPSWADLKHVTPEIRAVFLNTKYGMRELKRDVSAIKRAMKSVRR